MRMVFLRGAVPPSSEHPEKLLYSEITECEDMWTQLFYSVLNEMDVEGELVYQNGNMLRRFGRFTERWVPALSGYRPEIPPDVVICRGGFDYYDPFLRAYPKAKKIYYGAGRRYYPESDFKDYDLFLSDDPIQVQKVSEKTSAKVGLLAKPAASLFRPVAVEKEFDLCFMANFTRNPAKRFDGMLRLLKDEGLKMLAIGNIEQGHKDLARQLGMDIEFRDWVLRKDLPRQICRCKVGVCGSDHRDSCPRVVPEFLACGLPVVVANDLSIWKDKYITPQTGVSVPFPSFAEGVRQVVNSLSNYSPREYYERELSLQAAARRMSSQIRSIMEENL